MKWGKPKPKLGTVQVRERFLWFPMCFNGVCRWLERAEVELKYYRPHGWTKAHWLVEGWAEEGLRNNEET